MVIFQKIGDLALLWIRNNTSDVRVSVTARKSFAETVAKSINCSLPYVARRIETPEIPKLGKPTQKQEVEQKQEAKLSLG